MLDAPYVDAIKGFEGFAPTASWDFKQHSNGYGTRAQYPGETIDRDTAQQRFDDAMAKASAHVESVNPNLSSGTHAALADLTYNAGPGWSNSGLGDAVRSGDMDAAKKIFLTYNHAGGQVLPALDTRRKTAAGWFDASQPMTTAFADTKGKAHMADPMQTAMVPTPVFNPASRRGTAAQPAPEDASLSAKFLAGGPGALFGAPNGVLQQAGGTPGYDLGRGLQQGGMGLLSINHPEIMQAAIAQQGQNKDNFAMSYDKDNGTLLRIRKSDGKVDAIRSPGWTGEKVDPGALKSLTEDWATKYEPLHNAAERAQYFKDAIDSNKLDLSPTGMLKAKAESYASNTSESSRLLNEYQAFRQQLMNDSLRLNKGVQTEGDALRSYNEQGAGAASYDPKTMSTLLGNFVTKSGKVNYEAAKGQLDTLSGMYNNPQTFAPYYSRLDAQKKFYDNYGQSEAAKLAPRSGTNAATRPPLSSIFK